MHVHSTYTVVSEDGLLPAGVLAHKELFERAADMGLDAVCITERDFPEGHAEAMEAAKAAGDKVKVFFGVEIVTEKGHLLLYPPEVDQYFLDAGWEEAIDPGGDEYLDPARVIAEVGKRGYAVVASVPPEAETGGPIGDSIYRTKGLAAVEVRSARRAPMLNGRAEAAAKNARLPGLGGSGVLDDPQVLGRVATLFPENVADQKAFCEAIRAGNFWLVDIGPESGAAPRPRSVSPGDRGGRGGRGRRGRGRGRGDGGGRGGRGRGRGRGRGGGRGGGGGGRGGRGRGGGGRRRD